MSKAKTNSTEWQTLFSADPYTPHGYSIYAASSKSIHVSFQIEDYSTRSPSSRRYGSSINDYFILRPGDYFDPPDSLLWRVHEGRIQVLKSSVRPMEREERPRTAITLQESMTPEIIQMLAHDGVRKLFKGPLGDFGDLTYISLTLDQVGQAFRRAQTNLLEVQKQANLLEKALTSLPDTPDAERARERAMYRFTSPPVAKKERA